jgi:hypothetical protein
LGAIDTNKSYDSFTVAIGDQVLRDLTTGNTNTAIGYKSGHTLSNGINNTFLGGFGGATSNSFQ